MILNKRLGYIEDTLTGGDEHKKDLLAEFVCLVNDKLRSIEVKCPTCEKLHYIELDISENSHPAVLEEKFCSGGCWDIKRG